MTEKNCNSHLHWLLLPMHMPNILCSAENRMLKVSNGTCISSQQFASQIIFNPKGQRLNPLNNLVDWVKSYPIKHRAQESYLMLKLRPSEVFSIEISLYGRGKGCKSVCENNMDNDPLKYLQQCIEQFNSLSFSSNSQIVYCFSCQFATAIFCFKFLLIFRQLSWYMFLEDPVDLFLIYVKEIENQKKN